ncbi:hypothetical protein GA0070614_3669 [Micromonospora coxensis]|uniref:Uncharacterized protein n=1 Tax=Micromonospora coxensis TaxID=356852 RepID=A0A1C5IZZ3_9ACTN|nr:hypothetical protein [Micromonospora coxensis]SCG63591.1 hypothetical protein GA0070614_3669 [Micromonospora coxensis]
MSLTPPDIPPRPVRQLSLFGTEAADPSVADLAGLLAGPGEVVRMGRTARLSIVVDAAWRVHVLVAELRLRGLAASWEATEDQRFAVRTSYARTLAPLATAWLAGPAGKRPPAGFHLNGRRLRLWLAAAGAGDPAGFLLGLGGGDQEWWPTVRAALAAVGLPTAVVEPDAGGPAFRIASRRRLARLAELVGERPSTAPPESWPAAPA